MTLETSLRQVESTKLRYDISHTMRVKSQKSGTRSGTFSERIQAMIEKLRFILKRGKMTAGFAA